MDPIDLRITVIYHDRHKAPTDALKKLSPSKLKAAGNIYSITRKYTITKYILYCRSG